MKMYLAVCRSSDKAYFVSNRLYRSEADAYEDLKELYVGLAGLEFNVPEDVPKPKELTPVEKHNQAMKG